MSKTQKEKNSGSSHLGPWCAGLGVMVHNKWQHPTWGCLALSEHWSAITWQKQCLSKYKACHDFSGIIWGRNSNTGCKGMQNMTNIYIHCSKSPRWLWSKINKLINNHLKYLYVFSVSKHFFKYSDIIPIRWFGPQVAIHGYYQSWKWLCSLKKKFFLETKIFFLGFGRIQNFKRTAFI